MDRGKKNNSEALLSWYRQIAHCSSAGIHYLPEKSEVRASVAESFCKSQFQISIRMHPGIHFWNTSSFSVYCLQMDLMVSEL